LRWLVPTVTGLLLLCVPVYLLLEGSQVAGGWLVVAAGVGGLIAIVLLFTKPLLANRSPVWLIPAVAAVLWLTAAIVVVGIGSVGGDFDELFDDPAGPLSMVPPDERVGVALSYVWMVALVAAFAWVLLTRTFLIKVGWVRSSLPADDDSSVIISRMVEGRTIGRPSFRVALWITVGSGLVALIGGVLVALPLAFAALYCIAWIATYRKSDRGLFERLWFLSHPPAAAMGDGRRRAWVDVLRHALAADDLGALEREVDVGAARLGLPPISRTDAIQLRLVSLAAPVAILAAGGALSANALLLAPVVAKWAM
jgi:hypothetical protein